MYELFKISLVRSFKDDTITYKDVVCQGVSLRESDNFKDILESLLSHINHEIVSYYDAFIVVDHNTKQIL